MLDITKFSAMLKTVYRDVVRDTLNSEVKIWSRFRQLGQEVWEGAEVKWALRVGRSYAFGPGRAGAPLPDPSYQKTTNMVVPLRYYWGRIGIDVPVMKVARTNRGSFKRALDYEVENFKTDFTDMINEEIWGDGRGILALVNGNGGGTTTLNVDTPGGLTGTLGARFLQPDMKVSILNDTGTAIASNRRIVSVGAAGTSVVLNQAVSAAQAPDNGIIVRCPRLDITEVADASYNVSAMGMLGHLDDGTNVNVYHGINRSTYEVARSTVFTSVGALNLDVLQQLTDVCDQRGNGVISEYWCHHSVRRSYLYLTVANRQFISTGGVSANDIGFKGAGLTADAEFNGKPIKVDKDAPFGTIFALDPRYLLRFVNTDFEWADEDGNMLDRVEDVDAFEARSRFFFNTAYDKPNASGRLDGVSATVVIAHIL